MRQIAGLKSREALPSMSPVDVGSDSPVPLSPDCEGNPRNPHACMPGVQSSPPACWSVGELVHPQGSSERSTPPDHCMENIAQTTILSDTRAESGLVQVGVPATAEGNSVQGIWEASQPCGHLCPSATELTWAGTAGLGSASHLGLPL